MCGGGFAGQALPASLAVEGQAMLQALLDDLQQVPALQLLLPLDSRCRDLTLPSGAAIVSIAAAHSLWRLLPELIAQVDAVWPIAPESGGVLSRIAGLCLAQQKILLASPPATIDLCADKYATYQHLSAAGIAQVATALLSDVGADYPLPAVIKPRDGLGCQGAQLIRNSRELSAAKQNDYIIQPYHSGPAVSLSALFKNGQAWLLCCNHQQMLIDDNRFILQACQVNTANPQQEYYQMLLQQLAAALPKIWGFIGVDLIETPEHGPLLLEINPRLTSSYAGIRQATGINPAAQVLALLEHVPDLPANRRQTVTVELYNPTNLNNAIIHA